MPEFNVLRSVLRPEDTLKMAVKLESIHSGRTRYLVIVSRKFRCVVEENCLLGIDHSDRVTIGLVIPIWADTLVTLDGDGGFSVSSSGRHHIFKPVSVQAMWYALQAVHQASGEARQYNHFPGGSTHQWTEFYERRISSDRSCLNEWNAMNDLISRRPLSPDLATKPKGREETENLIRAKLKQVMMAVNLDEVTSKDIRTKLEEKLEMNLNEFKSFIDQEMLTILGQMDAPSEICEYLYLGTEWNASNLEELKHIGITKILNVTREIDNFYPEIFDYYNIRVYDDETTELLKHWDNTYRYILDARNEGGKVLVHCKMGISRSASVVVAYLMKYKNWNLAKSLEFVKNRRSCVKPNTGFLEQLEVYQGILNASKQRHNSLWRSKSETNISSSSSSSSPTVNTRQEESVNYGAPPDYTIGVVKRITKVLEQKTGSMPTTLRKDTFPISHLSTSTPSSPAATRARPRSCFMHGYEFSVPSMMSLSRGAKEEYSLKDQNEENKNSEKFINIKNNRHSTTVANKKCKYNIKRTSFPPSLPTDTSTNTGNLILNSSFTLKSGIGYTKPPPFQNSTSAVKGRKMQQGKSHPLTKLVPPQLYNTM